MIELVSATVEAPPKIVDAPVLAAKPPEKKAAVQPTIKQEPPKTLPIPERPRPIIETQVVERPKAPATAPIELEKITPGAPPQIEQITVAAVDAIAPEENTLPASGISEPRYLHNPEPTYPSAAKRRHQEGTVVLLVALDANGRADSIDVKQSSGFSILDDAATRAVRRWKFDPAQSGGRPVPSKVQVPVRFQLSK